MSTDLGGYTSSPVLVALIFSINLNDKKLNIIGLHLIKLLTYKGHNEIGMGITKRI